MGYIKLSNNKYRIIIEQGYDYLGKRTRKTKIVKGTLQDVKVKHAELMNKYYHKGEKVNLNSLTFRDYSKYFIDRHCKKNVSNYTRNGYEQLLVRINLLIGDIKLNDINELILEKMYNKLKKGTRKIEVSNETISHYYTLINIMLNKAVKWKLIDKNPNLLVDKPKKEKYERHYYDVEEVNKLFNCVKNESIKYRTLITLAIDSGARRGEICALKWSDVNFEKGTLLIDNSLKIINGVVDEQKPKTIYSNREIYLSEETLNLLKEYKSWQNNYIKELGSKWIGTNRIFTDNVGNHMHPDTCNKILDKIIKKYNLRRLRFHELRHTCTSLLINGGINPKAVSERLGHANANITMNIYTHIYDSAKKECANNLNKIIKNV